MPPTDRMDPTAYPWPKRWNVTRLSLRNCYYSLYRAAVSVNFATHILFNQSTGPKVIIVRSFGTSGQSSTQPMKISTQRGFAGANLGTVTPYWPGEAVGSGAHLYLDTATAAPDTYYETAAAAVEYNLTDGRPLFILPPQYGLWIQAGAAAQTVTAGFWWEEMSIDDPMLGSIGTRN